MTYASARDKRTADTAFDGQDLMCRAHGCPNRWSVTTEAQRNLCSAHMWSEPHHWPRITEELQRAETDRIIERQRPKPEVAPLSRADKTAILGRMRSLFLNSKIAP